MAQLTAFFVIRFVNPNLGNLFSILKTIDFGMLYLISPDVKSIKSAFLNASASILPLIFLILW